MCVAPQLESHCNILPTCKEDIHIMTISKPSSEEGKPVESKVTTVYNRVYKTTVPVYDSRSKDLRINQILLLGIQWSELAVA